MPHGKSDMLKLPFRHVAVWGRLLTILSMRRGRWACPFSSLSGCRPQGRSGTLLLEVSTYWRATVAVWGRLLTNLVDEARSLGLSLQFVIRLPTSGSVRNATVEVSTTGVQRWPSQHGQRNIRHPMQECCGEKFSHLFAHLCKTSATTTSADRCFGPSP